jgi:cobalt-zinc-cadmium efflux system protein
MGHDHSHGPADYNKAFAIGVGLNLAYVGAEVVFGLMAHSLALVADAGHNLTDVLSLLVAWAANRLSRSQPTIRYTYGLRSTSILASLANALILLIVIGAIAWEAIRRFRQPQEIAAGTVMAVAAIGVVVNTLTALLFVRGRHSDLNIKGAFLHMAADAGVSLGVVVSGFAISRTGLTWIDPVTTLIIVAVIAFGTWGLLRESVDLALQAVPSAIDLDQVREYLRGLPAVTEVHDLHIWPMSTTETALTAHLVRSVDTCDTELLERTCKELHDRFQIEHTTIQFETEGHDCRLGPENNICA